MKKPRVVILSAFLSPLRSGAEACAEEVALALRHRYDIVIVTSRLRCDLPRRDLLKGEVPVIRVGLGTGFDKWLFPILAPLAARRLRPRIIHAVLESFAGFALIICCALCPKVSRILTCQSTNTRWFLRIMHACADRVTVISSVLVQRAKAFGRKDVSKIPNGINLAALTAAVEAERKVAGRLLFVGRLEPMKGVDTLLDAFATIVTQQSTAHLRIVGGGALRARLERRYPLLIESGRITFLGYVPAERVAQEYARAEIFCGLSRSEALGNVFLEAQASGCAVIATRVGGVPDIVEDGVTGLLVHPDAPLEAAAALRELLGDPVLRQRLTDAARARVKDYDWNLVAQRYAVIYDELLR